MTQEHTENIQSPEAPPHKNVQGAQREVLYTGKRVKREVQYVRVHNHRTGEFHHDSIAFKTYRRKNAESEWEQDEKTGFSLSENHEGELSKALAFIARCRDHGAPSPSLTSTEAPPDVLQGLQSGSLKERMATLFQAPTPLLQQGQLMLTVATYRKALKGLHQLLKAPDQSAERLFTFFKAYPELLLQSTTVFHTRGLPPHTLGFQHPLTGQQQWVCCGPYQQGPLFQLNAQCSTWIPTEGLNTVLGELTYELRSLMQASTSHPEILVLVGDTADAEQASALALFQQHQRYRFLSYTQLLQQSTAHLKTLQEQLKQSANHP